jgi:hypothetical protein
LPSSSRRAPHSSATLSTMRIRGRRVRRRIQRRGRLGSESYLEAKRIFVPRVHVPAIVGVTDHVRHEFVATRPTSSAS